MTQSDLTPNEPSLIPKPDGYRKMSDEELALFNEITEHANKTGELVNRVMEIARVSPESMRFASIGKTKLQLGYMALKRAVALPANF